MHLNKASRGAWIRRSVAFLSVTIIVTSVVVIRQGSSGSLQLFPGKPETAPSLLLLLNSGQQPDPQTRIPLEAKCGVSLWPHKKSYTTPEASSGTGSLR